MSDDIIQAEITTKPRFEKANFRFYHELIPKAAMMKRIPTYVKTSRRKRRSEKISRNAK